MAANAAQQIILEEEFDENYEPDENEILEYAKFLGMDEHEDKHLFWIARESLKAPLPADWKPCQSDDGNIYYFNFSTGDSIWDHPCDEHYRQLYEREKKKGKPTADAAKSDIKKAESAIPVSIAKIDTPSTNQHLKPLPTLPSSNTLKPVSGLAPLSSLSTPKPQPSMGNTLGSIKPNPSQTSPNASKLAVTSNNPTKKMSDKNSESEESMVEEDVEDFDLNDDDFMPQQQQKQQHKKTPPTTKKQQPFTALDTSESNPDSTSELSKSFQRAPAIIEQPLKTSTRISMFDTGGGGGCPAAGKSDAPVVKNGADNISRVLNRLSSDSLDLSSDEEAKDVKSQRKDGFKPKSGSINENESGDDDDDDVSDFDEDALSFPGLEDKKKKPLQLQKNQHKSNNDTSESEKSDQSSSKKSTPYKSETKVEAFASKTTSVLQKTFSGLDDHEALSPNFAAKKSDAGSDLSSQISSPIHASSVASLKIQSLESVGSAQSNTRSEFALPTKHADKDTSKETTTSHFGTWSQATPSHPQLLEARSVPEKPSLTKTDHTLDAAMDVKLDRLRSELDEAWHKTEKSEKAGFEMRVTTMQREYESRLKSIKDEEETNLKKRTLELEQENKDHIRELRRQHEDRVKTLKHDLNESEEELRMQQKKRLHDIETENRAAMRRFEDGLAAEFTMFKSSVTSKFEDRRRDFEETESRAHEKRVSELKHKNEMELTELRQKMSASQAATLASNLDNLTELERTKYETEKESIRVSFETKLAEFKSQEQKKFERMRSEIESSTATKLEEIRDIGNKNVSEEQALLEKLVKIQSEDARQKEELARTRIKTEHDLKMERIRLDLEATARNEELDLQQSHAATLEAFRVKAAQEHEDNKRRITQDHARMIASLEKECHRKIEEIKFKLFENEKETEMKLISEREMEVSSRREKAEAEMRDVARLERDVENARNTVIEEKKALVQMERGIAAALVENKAKSRMEMTAALMNTKAALQTAANETNEDFEAALSSDVESSEEKESPARSRLRSFTEAKINRIIENKFNPRSVDLFHAIPTGTSSNGALDERLKGLFKARVGDRAIAKQKSDLTEVEEMTKELAERTATLSAQLDATLKNSQAQVKENGDAALTSFTVPANTMSFIAKPAQVPLTISELDSQLSSMLGQARVSKDSHTHGLSNSAHRLKTHSKMPASSSSYATTHVFSSPPRSKPAWSSSASQFRATKRELHIAAGIHANPTQIPRRQLLSSGGLLTDWEGGRIETDCKLAERKAWLDRFLVEKQRL
ncbi:hypothetical protein HDU81_003383 [Chytriomyces hyalinus]|nr:hypothetical protein HDU81_003383 [Chytriomyces hyalinus]